MLIPLQPPRHSAGPLKNHRGEGHQGLFPVGSMERKCDIKLVSTYLQILKPSRAPSRSHPTTQGCPIYAPSIALWKHHSDGLQRHHWHSYGHRSTTPGWITCQTQCYTAGMHSVGAICPCHHRRALSPVLFSCLRHNQYFPQKGPFHRRVRCCM